MTTRFAATGTAIAIALLSILPATASHAYTGEQQQLCMADALKLCASEIPDVDRITACMARKRASLSEGCRSVFRAEPSSATPVSYAGKSGRAARQPPGSAD
jgi:hypothetical protein